MNLIVNTEFVIDLFKLALYIACGYVALNVYARHVKTRWVVRLTAARFAVLTLLSLLVVAIKVFEDVVTKESGPVDAAVLWFVRQIMPPAMFRFFEVVTLTGAARFLVPATVALSVFFYTTRHRQQAVLLATSMACGWALTYTVKSLVDRTRPELWSTTWYWGSSFPSGHTLSTAAFATALVIGTAQIWPKSRFVALPLAVVWVTLMGVSRLVLGVHWPTDVLAATCLGVFIPLAISLVVFKDDKHLVVSITTERENQATLNG